MRKPSSTNWWTGRSSTAVMPRPSQVLDRGRVREARVRAADLRRDGGMAEREALDVGLVDDRGMLGMIADDGRPSQSNARSTTIDRGTNGALSTSSRTSGWPATCPKTAGDQRTSPSIASAYGSRRSLAGLQRRPAGGLPGPVHAIAVALTGPDARAGTRASCSRSSRAARCAPRGHPRRRGRARPARRPR